MPESTRADRANTIQDDNGRAAAPTPLAELRLAPGTRYTYDRALLGLDRWLDGRPLTDGSLADCLGALFDRGLAVGRARPTYKHFVLRSCAQLPTLAAWGPQGSRRARA